jgi:hypothetical protein
MEAMVDGSKGVFAAAVNADDGMVVATSTAATPLTTTIAITAATIGQRHHCRGCHFVIDPPSHRRLHQQHPPSTKTTIAAATIDHRFR